MPTLEICTATLQTAQWAAGFGAQRIELCENLAVGGITPSDELLQEVLKKADIRCHVLIRPRPGDFVYSNKEMDLMISSIHLVKQFGAQGVVIGLLDKNGNLDEAGLKIFCKEASGLSITFHRAIDVSADPMMLLKKLVDLGIGYVLTSGAKPTATEGVPMLMKMQQEFGKQINIMAGGGVNSKTISVIASQTGISQFHGSAKRTSASNQPSLDNQFGISDVASCSITNEDADPEEIKRLVSFCKRFDLNENKNL
jgi:copper homeostasis protein